MDTIYKTLADLGYTHPLHAAVTHIPIGLIIGGFLFALAGGVLKRPALSISARHCLWLALLFLPLVVFLGITDWQHFHAGAWLTPIIMKMILATVLLALLLITLIPAREKIPLLYHGLCLLVAVGLGFFGGELVYGTRASSEVVSDELVKEGASLFSQKCAMCHYQDRADTRVGPGLKDLFRKETLPVSGKPVTEENVKAQLKKPFAKMPAFEDLTEDEANALIRYLKTF